jgi:proteasome alpha subunit
MLVWKATAIGSGRDLVMPILEQSYRDDMDQDEAILLGLRCLNTATEGKISKETTEVAIVDENKKFHKFDEDEVEKFISKFLKSERK